MFFGEHVNSWFARRDTKTTTTSSPPAADHVFSATQTHTHVRGSTHALPSSGHCCSPPRRKPNCQKQRILSNMAAPCRLLCVYPPGCFVAEWRKLRASAGGEKAEHLDKSATTSTTSPILANARLRRRGESSERERQA